LPGSYIDRSPFAASGQIKLAISDGVNLSELLTYSMRSHQMLVRVIAPNRYLGIGPFSSIRFHFLIRPFGHFVQIKYRFYLAEGETQGTFRDMTGSFNCVPDGVVFDVPASVLDETRQTYGRYYLEFVISSDDGSTANESVTFQFAQPDPAISHPTLEIINRANGDFGSFSASNLPDVTFTVRLTGDSQLRGRLYAAIPDEVEGWESIGTGDCVTELYFYDLSPGRHTFGFFFRGDLGNSNTGSTHFSNVISLSYTITPGTLTVRYAGSASSRIIASGESTMRFRLTITATGFAGTGPLELEYSTDSTSEWNSYPDTVVTGTADYDFPISEFSTDETVFSVRVSSEQMTSGTTSMTCTGLSCVENIVVEPTANDKSSGSGSGKDNQDSKGLGGGAIAGIVIGVVVVISAGIAAGVFFYKEKKNRGVSNKQGEP
jgi:hypothetical protein